MNGVIMSGGRSKATLNFANYERYIDKAFKENSFGHKPSAVALIINSPGGSPVQSALISNRIRYLSKKHNIPTLAFAEDMAASGGYWLLCSCDKIYANECSIVGSIGVITGGFGFQETIKKLGIERRIYTAGKNKSRNDWFQEVKEEDVAKTKVLLDDLHKSFISHVKSSRGEKLSPENDEEIFNADVFLAPKAKELGLIDDIYIDQKEFLIKEFGENVKINVLNKRRQSILSDFLGFSSSSTSIALEEKLETGIDLFMQTVEETLLRQKHGL